METLLEESYEGKPNPRLVGVRIQRTWRRDCTEPYCEYCEDLDHYKYVNSYEVKLWKDTGAYVIGDLSFRIDGTIVSRARFRGEPVSRANMRHLFAIFSRQNISFGGWSVGSCDVWVRISPARSMVDKQMKAIIANMEEVFFEHLVRHRNWKSLGSHGVLELNERGEKL